MYGLLRFYEEKLHFSKTFYELKEAASKEDTATIYEIIEKL